MTEPFTPGDDADAFVAALNQPNKTMLSEMMDPFSLDAVVGTPDMKPVRAVFYGPHGIGKTTLAANFPAAIGAFSEDGVRNIQVKRFPRTVETYDELARCIGALLSAPHSYQTFFQDSLDWTESLVWAETCKRNRINSIEDPGYGKGYLMADVVWAELLAGFDALREAGMHVVLIAHSEITTFNPPESEPYNRYDLALHKRARAMIHEWADVVGFCHEKTVVKTTTEGSGKLAKTSTKAIGSAGRVLALIRKGTHEAKNGYGLPDEIPLDADTATNLLAAIADSFTPAAA